MKWGRDYRGTTLALIVIIVPITITIVIAITIIITIVTIIITTNPMPTTTSQLTLLYLTITPHKTLPHPTTSPLSQLLPIYLLHRHSHRGWLLVLALGQFWLHLTLPLKGLLLLSKHLPIK